MRQRVVAVSVGRRFDDRLSLRGVGGAIIDGDLEGEGRRYAVGTGWLASVVGAARLYGEATGPFVLGTLSFGVSHAPTRESGGAREHEAITSSDARVGAELGWSLFRVWSPYLAARAFGGPVAFRQNGKNRTGSDRHHYALGFGHGVRIGKHLDFSFDATLLGERAISWGLGSSW